jgi:hypothetical protein
MTPGQAAMIIQNAWRVFDDDRKAKFCAEYQAELMDTYYSECYTPVDNDDDDSYYDYNTETWVKW